MLRITAVAVFAAAACGGRTELVVPEALDASPLDANLPDATAPHDAEAEPAERDPCDVTLSVGDVTATAGCWIDEKVSHRTAQLQWACEAGAAEADFGVPFYGTVQEPSSALSLVATTTFHWWGDGCTWQSTQVIDGDLSSGALQYGYSEKPIQGTNCAPAYCTGSAVVSVQ